MAYQVKRSYVTIVTILIGLLGYGAYILSNTELSSLTAREFGMYLFLIVPVLVVTQIIGKIVFDIFNQTSIKKEEPKTMDEFDRIIEYKSVRNFSFVFFAGFFIMCLMMWISASIVVPFIIMFSSIFLAGIILQVSYIVYYNRGL